MLSTGLQQSGKQGYINLVKQLETAKLALDNAASIVYTSDSQFIFDKYHTVLHNLACDVASISGAMDRLGYRSDTDITHIAIGGMDRSTWEHLRK